ncbi:hypothetical protein H696_05919 [Fonticula alba]|uniref:ribonuclease Z n=1 Tax=Fonticula alba TaxID=691883 RepID=A0A058Z287_FONAL|nr:hypothetical protein H696_05919 [Fonticula alba]KCV67632.1 hypothetical protein H696_05919 [Fonticula alba]|eukprot:XP_009497970.1 hypothetical protein H696_05919 [Fonticula alba]
MAAHLQVLSAGQFDAPPALILHTRNRRYLIQCPEGSQRLLAEYGVALGKLDTILLTRVAPAPADMPAVNPLAAGLWCRSIGGLPGLALTLGDAGHALPASQMAKPFGRGATGGPGGSSNSPQRQSRLDAPVPAEAEAEAAVPAAGPSTPPAAGPADDLDRLSPPVPAPPSPPAASSAAAMGAVSAARKRSFGEAFFRSPSILAHGPYRRPGQHGLRLVGPDGVADISKLVSFFVNKNHMPLQPFALEPGDILSDGDVLLTTLPTAECSGACRERGSLADSDGYVWLLPGAEAAALPAVCLRFACVSANLLTVHRVGAFMVDCGEGTIAQLYRTLVAGSQAELAAGLGGEPPAAPPSPGPGHLAPALDAGFRRLAHTLLVDLRGVFITHMHADHLLGVLRLLEVRAQLLALLAGLGIGPRDTAPAEAGLRARVLHLLGVDVHRTPGRVLWRPLPVVGPAHLSRFLAHFQALFGAAALSPYAYSTNALLVEEALVFGQPLGPAAGTSRVSVRSVPVFHCPHAFGFVFTHEPGPEAGAPSGQAPGGQSACACAANCWRVIFSGDTRPTAALARAALEHPACPGGSGMPGPLAAPPCVLVHEATFDDTTDNLVHARQKRHSTALEALAVATAGQMTACVLTHFSQKYNRDPGLLGAAVVAAQTGRSLQSVVRASSRPMAEFSLPLGTTIDLVGQLPGEFAGRVPVVADTGPGPGGPQSPGGATPMAPASAEAEAPPALGPDAPPPGPPRTADGRAFGVALAFDMMVLRQQDLIPPRPVATDCPMAGSPLVAADGLEPIRSTPVSRVVECIDAVFGV